MIASDPRPSALGLGSDAIIASLAAGEQGEVRGIEKSPLLAFLVEAGLSSGETGPDVLGPNPFHRLIQNVKAGLPRLKPRLDKKSEKRAFFNSAQDDVLVVGKERFELYHSEGEKFFFHPNSAMFRAKRMLRGEPDPFVEAAQVEHFALFACGKARNDRV